MLISGAKNAGFGGRMRLKCVGGREMSVRDHTAMGQDPWNLKLKRQAILVYDGECLKIIVAREHVGYDHTSTNAPDPIRTPKLSMLRRS
ncbi:hypothetical protein FNV43_RR02433 [Rhamnella rubrinervis]|uniref:Uncharacterized protein n=1 Tax=Rhamnella rubrinervis TaxID=2594499 RepID=A0A8K0MTQ0_9ROSA|nr:hypothetical protein FNV43_RR02433 [Rhamnella rubrinervis]